MQIVILIVAMIVVGLLMGWVAGFIWKERSPDNARRDYVASVITAVIVGFMDWYIIPAMGLEKWKTLAVATEPALGALIVLWLIRKAKS